jgi:predicted dehydrogenase
MDCLKAGDVAIFATPPAFRWVHFGYAIQKGLNVFMEKPTTVDGPTTRKMLALAEDSVKRNLKVGVGLMWRHSKIRREVKDRIQSGQIGEILAMRSYRMHGPAAFFESAPKPAGISELLYQIQRFHSFLWASGGCYSDFYIHNIDECCWMKDAWPVKAQASGGRHYRGNSIDQNFDNYSIEYTFADGTKFFLYGRCILGCYEQFDSSAHGTKGLASITHGSIYKGQNPEKTSLAWKSSQSEDWGYGTEWEDLVKAIREDMPYNEAKRGAEASLVTSMGRMAAHTGQEITYGQILNLDHEFAPHVGKLTFDSAAPLLAGPDGKYPVPQPGITKQREF